MIQNCVTFISALVGGTHLASSVRTSPSGIWFKHCSMIRRDSRISNIRQRYLKELPKLLHAPCVSVRTLTFYFPNLS